MSEATPHPDDEAGGSTAPRDGAAGTPAGGSAAGGSAAGSSAAGGSPTPPGEGPLGPSASMSDILARMDQLRGTPSSGSDLTTSSPIAGFPNPDGASREGGTLPPLPGTPGTPVPARRPRGRLLAGIGGVLALIVGVGWKVLLGVAVAGVGGQVLGSLFGGPFDHLPQSTRDGFEQRLDAALGPDAASLTQQAYEDRYDQMLVDGLPRLDDAPLIAEVRYLDEMYDRVDTATCATAVRSEIASASGTFELNDKMWATLSQDELAAHIDTQVSAIEASARKSPAQRTVTADAASPVLDELLGSLTSGQATVLDDLQSGVTRTDQEACDAGRALHDAELRLPAGDLAELARWIASP